jgi:Putative peptidoglycan binding domain
VAPNQGVFPVGADIPCPRGSRARPGQHSATAMSAVSHPSRSPEANLPAWPVLSRNGIPVSVSTTKSLQYLLNANGARIVVDGLFGLQTDAAVRAFQGSHGLVVDGVVVEQTWSKLIITVQRGDVLTAVVPTDAPVSTANRPSPSRPPTKGCVQYCNSSFTTAWLLPPLPQGPK